jgi:hypothetical protein
MLFITLRAGYRVPNKEDLKFKILVLEILDFEVIVLSFSEHSP